eukprot:TRINITY_DN5792_c0_g2_i3.p1 TRINITY_DN5792_c0_g2~~TRINITY_DN5792_c0_g2_i3.p1  ORF type:complete len:781 (+),score=165.94 TRINITY_DN5792_c0_g2_i3:227-2569(+)
MLALSLINGKLGNGDLHTSGGVAYVPQKPWIQNGSVQENILFGKSYNKKLYSRIVSICCLQRDFDQLQEGDATRLYSSDSVEGDMLSVLKKKICIARALYSEKNFYIFDDPFETLDGYTSRHIFEYGIRNLLREKVVILVSNSATLFPIANHVIFLDDGNISVQGEYDKILKKSRDFSNFVREIQALDEKFTPASGTDADVEVRTNREIVSDSGEIQYFSALEKTSNLSQSCLKYVLTSGILNYYFFVMFYFFSACAMVAANWWLQYWAMSWVNKSEPHTNTLSIDLQIGYFVGIYLGILFFQVLLAFCFMYFFIRFGIAAGRKVHDVSLAGIISASITFFNIPHQEIFKELRGCLNAIDTGMLGPSWMFISSGLLLLGNTVGVGVGNPWVMVTVPIWAIIFFMLQTTFRISSSKIEKLKESSNHRPFEHFRETLVGYGTIKAWNYGTKYFDDSKSKLDYFISESYTLSYITAWFSFRMGIIGALFQLVTFVVVIFTRTYELSWDAGWLVMSLAFCSEIPHCLKNFAVSLSQYQNKLIAVEKAFAFAGMPTERDTLKTVTTSSEPSPDWPKNNKIEFDNVTLSYTMPSGQTRIVLRNATFEIQPSERVGIVSKDIVTKDALVDLMFRLIDPANGTIKIDKADISVVNSDTLRQSIGILSSQPCLFKGTIRFNLDPKNLYTDNNLFEALKVARIYTFVNKLPRRLDEEVSEGGLNFSPQQRHLLCIARQVLRQPKILFVQSSVNDIETDSLIQKALKYFKKSTIIVIAQVETLHTVMSMNR